LFKSATWLLATAVFAPVAALAQAQPPAAEAPARPPAKTPAKPAPKTVEGVTVTGQGNEFRSSIDRRSYDITKDLSTTTGSIADALRNVPSVDVDASGNVSLRGDPNVTIMIDGKPSNQFRGPGAGQALQSLPADQIERVEVITNPSAAFSPEGTAGIINLITRKVRKAGRAGSIRANLGTAGRRNAGANVTYNSNKLTLSADAGARHDPQHSTSADTRQVADPLTGQLQDTRRDFSLKGPLDQWNVRGGLDYDLDAKTRLSAELRHSDVTFDTTSTQPFVTTDPSGAVIADASQGDVSRQDRENNSGSLSLRRKFGEDHDLNVTLTQERTQEKNDDRLTTAFQAPAQSVQFKDLLARNGLDQTELKADYARPMPADGKLKLGYDLRINDNRYDVAARAGPNPANTSPDAADTDLFLYRQRLNALYGTYEQPFGDVTVLAGLRLEDERLDLDQVTTAFRVKRDELRAYPSLHLGYKLSEKQQLTASYSERVERPRPDQLNPFLSSQVFTAFQGNPRLEPQITHSFEAGWQYKDASTVYLATLFYRLNQHGVTGVFTDLGNGLILNTYDNLAHSQNAGLELVASAKLTKTLSYNVNGTAYWNEIDASNLGFVQGAAPRRSAFAFGGRASLNWQVTPNDLVQVSGQVAPKRLLAQGFSDPMFLMFLGYRHKFSDALSLVVTAQDPFDIYRLVQHIDTPALRERIDNRGRIQAAFVGLTWSFGAATKKPQSFDFSGA